MPYLMRVELPDVPGSLGRVASAIGEAGGDIEAIEIVEKRDGWINRYAAGGNLFLDLEVVEALTEDPDSARDRLIDLLPIAFRVDWAARVTPGPDGADVVHATDAAPTEFSTTVVTSPTRLQGDDLYVECAAPFGDDLVLMGRRGGPDFLDSELARLEHLLGLAITISRA